MRNFDNDLKLGQGRDHLFTEEENLARHGRADANGCCSSCGLDVINDLQESAETFALEHVKKRDGVDYETIDDFFEKYDTTTAAAMPRLLSSILCWAHLEDHEAGKKYDVSDIVTGDGAGLGGKSTARRKHLYFREIGCGRRPKCILKCFACHHLEDTLPRLHARQQAFRELAKRQKELSQSQ
jgi:hypothetical protein